MTIAGDRLVDLQSRIRSLRAEIDALIDGRVEETAADGKRIDDFAIKKAAKKRLAADGQPGQHVTAGPYLAPIKEKTGHREVDAGLGGVPARERRGSSD
jgi:hypothetical protein